MVLFIEQIKTLTISETCPNCDVNEAQEDGQGTTQIQRGEIKQQTSARGAKKKETSGSHRVPLRINYPHRPSFVTFCQSCISSKYIITYRLYIHAILIYSQLNSVFFVSFVYITSVSLIFIFSIIRTIYSGPNKSG